MIRVVMMTLVRCDDRGGVMNQEEADQDVADEVDHERVMKLIPWVR